MVVEVVMVEVVVKVEVVEVVVVEVEVEVVVEVVLVEVVVEVKKVLCTWSLLGDFGCSGLPCCYGRNTAGPGQDMHVDPGNSGSFCFQTTLEQAGMWAVREVISGP